MAALPPAPLNVDRYVVIHVATTCDEHGVYVTKDSAEVIEIGWILVDAKTLEELHHESVLVKPINTPITPLCTSLTTLTWEHVRNAGTFRDAINRFDTFASEHLNSQNLDFVFVTLDAWDLRVQLPREARDKAVVLPPYLQHSRTFDLRTEYQRWQQHHPECLAFGPSSLANICAALEVEAVQSSAPIKHNLPFHLQALAPASPRRAMDESITLARVLRGLVRKSQPPNEHPDVLTRPMDARADVRAFLSERSKVLHMSGLPHDTTQSELESWFTQFGGRPIAFWTLPVSAGPTGDMGYGGYGGGGGGGGYGPPAMMGPPHHGGGHHHGHMGHGGGGRMGGSGVVPFRAGDWKCGNEVCGYHNFAKNVCCLRCGASRAGAAIVADSGYPTPMDTPSSYMSQASMGGTPGPGPFGSGGGFNSGGGYGQQFGGPPSTYALPSGIGGGAAPYPSLNTHFGPGPGAHSAGPFDSRAAEAAFQSAQNGPASAGPSNNFYSAGESDPFAFLSSGIGGLSVSGGDPRQNGGGAPSKSPA
ncbi:putative asparagine-rich protein [Diaporthe ampelina]|uniref:Putative asparagine-rich protein n=1 Tax=Diaporthe ampelina TaxID=1214573 RepID=A0A0G2F8W6_9PEZI|nr:putative asparagine-rich protein [Diaporthe ampelina]